MGLGRRWWWWGGKKEDERHGFLDGEGGCADIPVIEGDVDVRKTGERGDLEAG